MKRFLLGVLLAALVGAGIVYGIPAAVHYADAATPNVTPPNNSFGTVIVSPAKQAGQFPYISGPQSSVVSANGGTFTANSGSAVTVANTNLTVNSVIIFGLKTPGGTPAAPWLVTVTPGTGFTVNSGGSDTSVYNYLILG